MTKRRSNNIADRIKPALKLSELTNEALRVTDAHRKIAEEVRASLQLPRLELLAKHTPQAAAAMTQAMAGLTSARELARAAASTAHARIGYEPAPPFPPTKGIDDTTSFNVITSPLQLGHLVREVREQRKLSQQGLADLVGVGRRFISELENGKVTLEFDRVLQVAAACGIDVLARRR
jgi:y4mF family transcriptional regulator